MEKQIRTTSDLFGILKSWFPQRSRPDKISRDFWMPDHSCRVCYECDSGFTIFNRRHHCRLCGRIFCGKCTANFIPAPGEDPDTDNREPWEKIRVCDFCFKLWERGIATSVDNDTGDSEINASCSLSADSFGSSEAGGSAFLTSASPGSIPYQFSRSDEVSENSPLSPYQSAAISIGGNDSGKSISCHANLEDQSSNQFQLDKTRIEYDEHNYSAYKLASIGTAWSNKYYNPPELHNTQNGEDLDNRSYSYSAVQDDYISCSDSFMQEAAENGDQHDINDGCEAHSSLSAAENVETEPVDFENNGLLWVPPEPENEEDEREPVVFDDDDGDGMGEWGSLYTSGSFDIDDHGTKDPSIEDRNTMKNVVDGHFRALVSQLLQVENLQLGENNAGESWLEIVTSLSLEAATVVKPDLSSKGEGMDLASYVKVKCLATGHRSESKVIKGVVCKKNVAHRRMTTKLEKPRVMILGGALQYQRVSNLLSSVDTLLKQEADHLKMAVAKIDAHHPDVLLVEKAVSRIAQEYILEKGISLVLNIKRPLLERIARCTGAQVVPSVDHLLSDNLGYCDAFHVEKYLETHGSAGQGGKMLTKTLMFFEDCPKPFGCTILLRGANGDELKKVKHVIQYGVFAAYHLGLETSFLADEGASLPEFSLIDPIAVALPNQSLSIGRSISLVPSLTAPPAKDNIKSSSELHLFSDALPSISAESCSSQKAELAKALSLPAGGLFQEVRPETIFSTPVEDYRVSGDHHEKNLSVHPLGTNEIIEDSEGKASVSCSPPAVDESVPPVPGDGESISTNASFADEVMASSEPQSLLQDAKPSTQDVPGTSKEVPPSCSDQSIVVSLSSRCVWKGTVCEKSRPLRIKYYGSFDKPLGRFLQDHLFDQGYRCTSCEMPSEAHVQCYTHRQGSLTISVKKLLEILLPGEREGKVWMWHRCLRCPRTNGFPPATRRIVMSDAAWGLSFGKFLELSFSNHAAASRVASCGHSLHRDCLRFFGCGKMVACFRYTSIDVHSVFLPPSKLDFEYESQGWIKNEVNEVVDRAEAFFSEVLNALSHITAQISGGGSARVGSKIPESRLHVAELEEVLRNEKREFEEALRKCLNREVKKGQPVVDILEINRLRRQLLFQSYMWDHRLVYASSSNNNSRSLMQSSLESIDKTNRKINVTLNLGDPLTPARSAKPVGSPEAEESNDSFFPDHVYQHLRKDSLDNQCSIWDHEKLDETVEPLDTGTPVRRALSDSHFSFLNNLSDTLDAAWTGESRPGPEVLKESCSFQLSGSVSVDPSSLAAVAAKWGLDDEIVGDSSSTLKVSATLSPQLSMKSKGSANVEGGLSWFGMPFLKFYRSVNKNFLGSGQKLDTVGGYNPVFVSSSRESELQSGARLLLPVGVNDTVIPVYDDEPTSIISYALVSEDYHKQLSDEDLNRSKEIIESAASLPLPEASSLQSFHYAHESICGSVGSIDDSLLTMSGSQGSFVTDPLLYSKSLHLRVSFSDNGPRDQVKYTVTCYCARQFEALRRICCPSEVDFVRSLSRCKKWGAQGGKSQVFFAKTLDERFIIKQVTKTELESFIKSAPAYFSYLTEAIRTKSPTSLAKIVGMYQVVTKHLKGGKESKMDVLVMENLLFGRKATRIYDLKGSSRSRYNPDASGTNNVLLDQNLIEAMPTSPIFVGTKAKLLLERAVWNDTAFLTSVDVMDYSLLVGIDEEKHELVVGIIDFMRQYTWDKHLETWAKASGILGGPKNASPTVISPQQYKKRFRKAMTTYFLKVQDDWAPPVEKQPGMSNAELCEESLKAGLQLRESESNHVYIT